MFATAIGAGQISRETNDSDALSMRTASVYPDDIEEYNKEKAEIHAELQAFKESLEKNDPTF